MRALETDNGVKSVKQSTRYRYQQVGRDFHNFNFEIFFSTWIPLLVTVPLNGCRALRKKYLIKTKYNVTVILKALQTINIRAPIFFQTSAFRMF